jgi:hypothetical protein
MQNGTIESFNRELRIMQRIGFNLFVILSAFLFTRCASTGFLMAKAKVTLLAETYPPKFAETKIDIFITNKPPQNYIEFARITCKDTNDKWNMEQVLKKAREIGADGIMLVGKAGSSGIGVPLGYSTYVLSEEYGITAIAIKYK